ncbi:hypothetical protein P389DRAFT_198895 [Cystobasidium minutum MCA 4210]|uniref:uncharacterized protein n=1 Tax=Cystobasidium minutum MCA 4210 TaxID=1397322 RepID=UPI0034CD06CE|eukprot:jgi/Rhomi1/198895/gm1.7109_g
MKLSSLVATFPFFFRLVTAFTPDDCYNNGYNTGYNDAYNDVRGKGLIDGAAGKYHVPQLAAMPGLTGQTAVDNACTADEALLTAYHRGFSAGYETIVVISGKIIYDLAYIEVGGVVPPEPSSQQARRKRHDAMVKKIKRAHQDQW